MSSSKLELALKLTTKEIEERIGTLSKPSKMPGPSWSIPASLCQTGRILAKIEGTPCSKCYARKGRYVFPNVYEAQMIRLRAWQNDEDWPELMAARILRMKGVVWFRWFDSGDLQSKKMLEDINRVAEYTKGKAYHWLPTQERTIVKDFVPANNLTIRVSSTKIGEIQNGWSNTSSISKDEDQVTCLSYRQNNKCQACRQCWDKNAKNIVYLQH